MNRPVSIDFIEAMEEGLTHGRAKGRVGWDSNWKMTPKPIRPLLLKFVEEIGELAVSIRSPERKQLIRKEAADVANLAMMLADACDALGDEPAPD